VTQRQLERLLMVGAVLFAIYVGHELLPYVNR
jgi:hypothetical protein